MCLYATERNRSGVDAGRVQQEVFAPLLSRLIFVFN